MAALLPPLRSAGRATGRAVADAARIAVTLVTLNARKTAWRLRGRRSRCPCQNPGDSGRPLETHCDAVLTWPRPARLRHACPALRVTPRGYFCSVETAAVRPHWGRAAAFYLGAVLLLGGGAATLVYTGLRITGVRDLAWLDVAWPGRWHAISRARSQYFCARSLEALGAGDVALARVALASAVETDPGNYDAALLLAMLSSLAPERQLSDASFRWLLEQHPAQANRTAIAFHDTLLAQGRPGQLADFALWMARHNHRATPMWVRSLLAALRLSGGAPGFARAHAAELRQLPGPPRALVAAEILVQQHQSEMARLALQRPLAPDDPVYTLLQVETLLRLGDTAAATVVKNALPEPENGFYPLALQYWIEKQHGNDLFAQLCFTGLISRQLTPEELDWTTALLIRAPDARGYHLLDARLRRQKVTAPPTAASMWAAATVCADADAQAYWAGVLQRQAHIALADGFTFDFGTLSPQRAASVPAVLGRVTLPRETIDALVSRVHVSR